VNAESTLWDEIADRLTVIYNKQRGLRSDVDQRLKANVRDEAELARLELLAAQYEALFAPAIEEGIPA